MKLLFTIFSLLLLTGCTSEFNLATGRQEMLLFDTQKEVNIGAKIAEQFDQHFEIISDVDLNQRVDRILERIIAICDRKELVYIAKIVNEDEMNAVSLPGGYIYVFKGLMDKVKNDDQLAGVIAHEVGHINAKHGIKRLQSLYGLTLLQVMAVATKDAQAAGALSTAYMSVFFEHSRQDEFEADRLGVKYMKKAGFKAEEMVGMLKQLKEQHQNEPIRPMSYWRTHPHLSERIAVTNQAVTGELEFKDYLNIMGSE